MIEWVMVPGNKTNNQNLMSKLSSITKDSLIPKTHMVEGKKQPPKVVDSSLHISYDKHIMHTYTHIEVNKTKFV